MPCHALSCYVASLDRKQIFLIFQCDMTAAAVVAAAAAALVVKRDIHKFLEHFEPFRC